MSAVQDAPAPWLRPFTVGDQAIIDTLDEHTRAAVERYLRAGGASSPIVPSLDDDAVCEKIADYVVDAISIRSDVESAVRSVIRSMRKAGQL